MLLSQLFEEQSIEDAIATVQKYTNDFVRRKDLDPSVSQVIQLPQYQYKGDMYRGIAFNPWAFLKSPSTQNLLSQMQRHERADRQNFSWSRSLDGASAAVHLNYAEGVYEDIAPEVELFVIKQNGTALDIEKMLGADGVVDVKEQELLAPYQGMPEIIGFIKQFHEKGMDTSQKLIPIDQMKEYIAEIKPKYEKVLQDYQKRFKDNFNTPFTKKDLEKFQRDPHDSDSTWREIADYSQQTTAKQMREKRAKDLAAFKKQNLELHQQKQREKALKQQQS